MYKLFLDDMRMPADAFAYTKNPVYLDPDWIIVRNYDQFIDAIIKRGFPYIISFDHDLSDEHYGMQDHIEYDQMTEKTGYHCAKWYINYCLDHGHLMCGKIYIHSMNYEGSKNIESIFRTYDKVYRGT